MLEAERKGQHRPQALSVDACAVAPPTTAAAAAAEAASTLATGEVAEPDEPTSDPVPAAVVGDGVAEMGAEEDADEVVAVEVVEVVVAVALLADDDDDDDDDEVESEPGDAASRAEAKAPAAAKSSRPSAPWSSASTSGCSMHRSASLKASSLRQCSGSSGGGAACICSSSRARADGRSCTQRGHSTGGRRARRAQ